MPPAAPSPLCDLTAGLAPPVVVFCKSHSGSRLLAEVLERLGVFLGEVQNESRDSLPMLPLVQHVTVRHHPSFADWWRHGVAGDPQVPLLLRAALDAHFGRRDRATAPWGWKLCETVYALPVIDAAFPEARYIHIVRDGRDVAFCDHTPADTPFWKQVYFGTDRLMTWRGRRLDYRAYRRSSHVFNATHWCASVGLGRTYGALLGQRYLEVRYEDLCRDLAGTAAGIAGFLGLEPRRENLASLEPRVSLRSIGKHRDRPAAALREVLEIEMPQLLALGYVAADPFRKPTRSLRRRLGEWWTAQLPRAA